MFDKTFLKFCLVGVVNTVFGTAVMFTAYNVFHLNYWISSGANYILGSILSFFLNKYLTFQNTSKDWKIILKFAINIMVCYLIAYGIAKPLAESILHSSPKVIRENGAMFVGMGLFVVLNYCGQRFFAFKNNSNDIKVK